MGAVVYALTVLMFAATFVLLRIVLPALVSLHNDGALICALILVIAMPIGWYNFWTHLLGPYLEGKFR